MAIVQHATSHALVSRCIRYIQGMSRRRDARVARHESRRGLRSDKTASSKQTKCIQKMSAPHDIGKKKAQHGSRREEDGARGGLDTAVKKARFLADDSLQTWRDARVQRTVVSVVQDACGRPCQGGAVALRRRARWVASCPNLPNFHHHFPDKTPSTSTPGGAADEHADSGAATCSRTGCPDVRVPSKLRNHFPVPGFTAHAARDLGPNRSTAAWLSAVPCLTRRPRRARPRSAGAAPAARSRSPGAAA